MLEPNSKKTMAQALTAWFESFSNSFNAIKVGKIIGVNYSNQTVDVQILHKKLKTDVVKRRELVEYPPLLQVPFIVLGGGSSSLTFPISVGDNCLLLFCDFEIDRWWESGEAQPSNYNRKHDISDAFAIIGIHSMVDLLQGYNQYVQLKYSNNSSIIIGENIDIQNSQTNVSGKLDVTDDITGQAKATAELHSTHGATGSFVSSDNKKVTVVDGIITVIE